MSDEQISNLLQKLESGDADNGWAEFLENYSTQIFAVVRCFDSDADDVSDCFQYVCEQLVADRFRRLRKFKPRGPAKFSTWLRAVVRNLFGLAAETSWPTANVSLSLETFLF